MKCVWGGGPTVDFLKNVQWRYYKTSQVSSSKSNNYAVTPLENLTCANSGDTFDITGGILECRWVNGGLLKWIKINTVKSTFENAQSPVSIDVCRLQNSASVVKDGNSGLVGFPLVNSNKHRMNLKGTNEVLIVPIDFPDFPGGSEVITQLEYDKKWMTDWYEYFSNGQSKFNVTTVDNWLRMPKERAAYPSDAKTVDAFAADHGRRMANQAQPFIDEITKVVDLRKFSTVYFFYPDGEITFVDFIIRNQVFKTKEGDVNLNLFSWGRNLEGMETLKWSYYIHETMHDFNITMHAPGNGWPLSIGTNQSGISLALNPWEQFLFDWLPADQIYCDDVATLKSATISLSPVEREDRQTKMAVIRLSPTKAIVVESHGIDKWSNTKFGDREFPPGFYSVMAYIVDLDKNVRPPINSDGTSLGNDDWAWAVWQKVQGERSNQFNVNVGDRKYLGEYVAVLGDSFVIEGVRIKVVGTGDYETIEITKLTSPPTIVEPKEIKSFQDAVDRPNDVSYWAWKKSSDQALSNNTKGPIVELIIGPNTKLSNPDPASAISAASRLYPEFKSPEKVFAIYYSYADIDWAQKKYAEVYANANGQEAKNGCQKIEYCWGASATINSLGNGIILSAVMTSNPDKNHTSGTLEAHEYTHVLQISSFFGTGNQNQAMCCIKAFAPWWFVEGGANFSQLAIIYANSFAKYSEERKNEANELLTNRDKKYTEKWIANFIKPPDTSAWREDGRESWHLYDLGMLVSEVFTAIKGPAINIQIFTDISKGMTFEKSFEQHFGLPWDGAVKMIAKYISLLVEN